MAQESTGGGSARTRWIIILSVAALGAFLYIRFRKGQSQQSAASQGQTVSDTSVPSYQLSGTYDGPYTPYNVITNGETVSAGYMPQQGGTIASVQSGPIQGGQQMTPMGQGA